MPATIMHRNILRTRILKVARIRHNNHIYRKVKDIRFVLFYKIYQRRSGYR